MRRESSCESRDGGGYKFAPTGCYRSVGGRNLAANAPNRGRRTARLFRASRDRAISIFVLSACTFVSSSKWYVCTSKDRGYSDSRGFQLSLSLARLESMVQGRCGCRDAYAAKIPTASHAGPHDRRRRRRRRDERDKRTLLSALRKSQEKRKERNLKASCLQRAISVARSARRRRFGVKERLFHSEVTVDVSRHACPFRILVNRRSIGRWIIHRGFPHPRR